MVNPFDNTYVSKSQWIEQAKVKIDHLEEKVKQLSKNERKIFIAGYHQGWADTSEYMEPSIGPGGSGEKPNAAKACDRWQRGQNETKGTNI